MPDDDAMNRIAALNPLVGWSMQQPPPVVRQQLDHLFAAHHETAPSRRYASATRVRDRETMVVRGDDSSECAVYTSDLADVTVRVEEGRISGHIIPIVRPTPSAFAVTVVEQPSIRSYEGNESGSFELTPLGPGSYQLILDNTHLEILIDVEIPEDRP